MYEIWLSDPYGDYFKIHVTNSVGVHVLEPKVKRGVNVIDSLSFSILPNNPGYTELIPMVSKAYVIDKREIVRGSYKKIFRGRLLSAIPMMDSNGVFRINCIFEGEMAYLLDSPVYPTKYIDGSIGSRIRTLINSHNDTMLTQSTHFNKKFKFIVEGALINSVAIYEITRGNTYDTMLELMDEYGGETISDYRFDGPCCYYGDRISARSDQTLLVGKNIQTIEQEKTVEEICTRVIPVGGDGSEPVYINGGDPSKPDWIGDREAEQRFGIVYKFVTFSGVISIDHLKKLGQDYLDEKKKIKIKYRIKALDLTIIGKEPMDHSHMFDLCHEYRTIVPQLGIDEYLRIVEMEIDLAQPQNTTITIGDRFSDIKHYNNFGVKAFKATKELENQIRGLK